jgi:integrase
MATVNKRRWKTRDGTTKEAWRVRYVDQHDATRTRQFDKKKEADAFRIRAEGEVALGVHTADRASVTVAEAADIHLAAAEAAGCDRGTIKTYREIARCHVVPLLGEKKLSRLDGPAVVAFRDTLVSTRSHAMASKAVRHLSMILNEAQSRGLVAQNVAHGVKVRRPRQDGQQRLAKRAEIPSITDLRAMLAAADRLSNEDPRLPVMLRIVMLAGLRASELRGLAWPGVHLRGPELAVSQRADRWNELGPPKSKAGYRTIPIGPALATMLKAWKLRCPPSSKGLVFPSRPAGRQWPSSVGRAGDGPIKQHTMAAVLLKVQVAAGVAIDTGERTADGKPIWKPRYDWHHLRHAAASNWLNDGIDLKRLQVWIGHENIQLTIDVNGHMIADAKKDAALAAGAEASLLG